MGDTRHLGEPRRRPQARPACSLAACKCAWVAAEARRLLVAMASTKLDVPAADPRRRSMGVVAAKADPAKKVFICGADRRKILQSQAQLEQGVGQHAEGRLARPSRKSPSEYKIVGKPFEREDIAAKVYSTEKHIQNHKVAGMVHGRMIRPSIIGSVAREGRRGFDQGHPWRQGRVQAAGLSWASSPTTEWGRDQGCREAEGCLVGSAQALPETTRASTTHIRKAPVLKAETEKKEGDVAKAFEGAAKVVSAEYEWPFQSHASMGSRDLRSSRSRATRRRCGQAGRSRTFARDGRGRDPRNEAGRRPTASG